jgi:hypothetical protein
MRVRRGGERMRNEGMILGRHEEMRNERMILGGYH